MKNFKLALAGVAWGKIGKNILIFSAPALFVLFYQLSQGASIKVAGSLAILVIYGVLADLFRKLKA